MFFLAEPKLPDVALLDEAFFVFALGAVLLALSRIQTAVRDGTSQQIELLRGEFKTFAADLGRRIDSLHRPPNALANATEGVRGLGMTFAISATVHESGRVTRVRYTAQSALEVALEYWRRGFTNIRVDTEDGSYSLEQFRMLVE